MKLIWGGHHGPLGGTSRTVGGDITDRWGGHHGPLGGTSRTKTPFNAAEILIFFASKLL